MTTTPDDDAAAELAADRRETEAAHVAGDHGHCDVTCEAKFPSEQMRNFVVATGYPGTARMIVELERRARAAGRADGLREGADALESDYPGPGADVKIRRAADRLRTRAGATTASEES